MITFTPTALDLIRFYAAEMADPRTPDIVSQMKIASEADARHVLAFCERMFDLAMRFQREARVGPGGPVMVYDAEKLHSLLSDLVAEQGFDHLLADE